MLIKCLLLTAILAAQQQNDPLIQFSFESLGHTYKYILTEEMLESSPKWSIPDNPPLPLTSAKAIAEKYAAKIFLNKKLNITSISMKKAFKIDRWYFVVELESPDLSEGPLVTYDVVILMNGTVVEPLKD